jgi:hypothetical protein
MQRIVLRETGPVVYQLFSPTAIELPEQPEPDIVVPVLAQSSPVDAL